MKLIISVAFGISHGERAKRLYNIQILLWWDLKLSLQYSTVRLSPVLVAWLLASLHQSPSHTIVPRLILTLFLRFGSSYVITSHPIDLLP